MSPCSSHDRQHETLHLRTWMRPGPLCRPRRLCVPSALRPLNRGLGMSSKRYGVEQIVATLRDALSRVTPAGSGRSSARLSTDGATASESSNGTPRSGQGRTASQRGRAQAALRPPLAAGGPSIRSAAPRAGSWRRKARPGSGTRARRAASRGEDART